MAGLDGAAWLMTALKETCPSFTFPGGTGKQTKVKFITNLKPKTIILWSMFAHFNLILDKRNWFSCQRLLTTTYSCKWKFTLLVRSMAAHSVFLEYLLMLLTLPCNRINYVMAVTYLAADKVALRGSIAKGELSASYFSRVSLLFLNKKQNKSVYSCVSLHVT